MSSVFVYGTLRPGQVNYSIVSAAVTEQVPARLDDHALRAAVTAGFRYGTVARPPGLRAAAAGAWRRDRSARRLDRLEAIAPRRSAGRTSSGSDAA